MRAVHKGDVIVAVDGVETRGMSSEDVKTLIMGAPETFVSLALRQVRSAADVKLLSEPACLCSLQLKRGIANVID
jgi:C-terminal processing protease CtpA/Prc